MSITIETDFHITTGRSGNKRLRSGTTPPPRPIPPRILRLMALAIHFDGLIREGVVKNYADLAQLGCVSRARITQNMNLLNLPPWKQEELLFLEGRAEVTERKTRLDASEIWFLRTSQKLNPQS